MLQKSVRRIEAKKTLQLDGENTYPLKKQQDAEVQYHEG
jgi:hypothetical protein